MITASGCQDKFLTMPSKIVANERVGINLPVYRFNAFLGHYQGFSVAVEISVKFLRETLHTNKVFLIFLRKKLKKTFVPGRGTVAKINF